LQLEVAKRIVPAARREDLGCRSYRRASWEAAAQSRSIPDDKWLLREEVAERRDASAKGSLSEEIAQQRKVAHSSIHPPILQFIHSFTHWFIDYLIHWCIGSLTH